MDRYLAPEMLKVFKAHNAEYPPCELDYRPLLKIAEFLCAQMKLMRGPENHAYEILELWEPICINISQDKFYCQKSLNTIANHIQELFQKTAYGDKSKSTKLNVGKLKQAIAARYSTGPTGER